MIFNKNSTFVGTKNRLAIKKKQIFFFTCALLAQSRFSPNLNYFFFKRPNFYLSEVRNSCYITKKRRSIIGKTNLSRLGFNQAQNSGFLVGYYKSI